MKRTDNPELTRKMLDHLADLYKIKEVRESNHLSSYVYCRTKGFLDQKQASEPTDEEVMLFALGYGLQDVLTPKDAKAPIHEYNGIIYRPDMVFASTAEAELLMELKTTRKSAKYHFVDEVIPLTWLAYMKGGCKIRGTNRYDLIVLYMMGNYSPPFPQIYCDTFIFEQQEIEENWQTILYNKSVLDRSLETGIMPEPFKHCLEFECKYCRYLMVCQAVARQVGKEQVEEDMKLWD